MRSKEPSFSRRWLKPFCLFLLSWCVCAFGQPAWALWLSPIAAFCGFALFWLSIDKVQDRRFVFLLSLLWFSGVEAIHLSWFTATTYHGVYILWVYVGLIIWLGAQFGILTVVMRLLKRFFLLRAAAIAGLWVLLEWSRLFFLCGFAFDPSGLALSYAALPVQLAAVLGVYGLSFIVVFVNVLVFEALKKPSRYKNRSVCMALLVFYSFGLLHFAFHNYNQSKEESSLNVALLQTGLRPEQKCYLPSMKESFIPPEMQWKNIFTMLSDSIPNDIKLDLIVLPEAAVPFSANEAIYPSQVAKILLSFLSEETSDVVYKDLMPSHISSDQRSASFEVSNSFFAKAISEVYSAEVIIGLNSENEGTWTNSALHFVPGQLEGMQYNKRKLVPLAEYLPFEQMRDFVAKYGIDEFSVPGERAEVYGNKIPIATYICYDECFGNLIREGRRNGAQLFVNITNDGWYLNSKLPKQHLYHGRLRSVENGVPLLRSCNTGITSVIDSTGRVRNQLGSGDDELQNGVLLASLNLYHFKTLYSLCGDYLIVFLSVFFISLYVFFTFRRKKKDSQL